MIQSQRSDQHFCVFELILFYCAIEILQPFLIKIFLSYFIRFFIKLTIQPCKRLVCLIMFPYLPIQSHHKLRHKNHILFLSQSPFESVPDCILPISFCDRKIRIECCLRSITCCFFNCPVFYCHFNFLHSILSIPL